MTRLTPPPLCEHPQDRLLHESYRARCAVCGSYWDLDSLATTVAYDESYPAERGHFDPRVGALKVRTLEHWVRAGTVRLQGKTVCEVGFGGGTCLSYLADNAAHVIGLEVNQSAIDRVRATGVRAELLRVDPLPSLARPVDLWLFQDSFEHIPDPAAFADWMRVNSAPAAEILLVAPRGDSLSRRLMGRFWPHKLPDHQFHWSRAGLAEFFGRRGFVVRCSFFPLKFASPQMVLAHFLHKLGIGESLRRRLAGASFALPINFGEHGLVFQRRDG
jgi:Methyltransferase domain